MGLFTTKYNNSVNFDRKVKVRGSYKCRVWYGVLAVVGLSKYECKRFRFYIATAVVYVGGAVAYSFIECKIEEMNNLVLPLTVDLQLH